MFGMFKHPRTVASGVAAERALIAAFGKLPIRADFIKHNVVERETRELDHWVQEGYSLISRRLNGARAQEWFPQAGIHHAVFSATDDKRAVLATIGPGSDQSGRWYPFVITTLAQAPFIRQVQAAIPLAYAPFFAHAQAVIGQRWRHEPLDTLLGCLEHLSDDCIDRGRGATVELELGLLRGTSLSCMRELGEQQAGDPAVFYQAVNDLLAAVVRRGAARTSWGVRLPLPSGEYGNAVLIFWLRLIDSLLGQNWSGNYFWRHGDAERQGHVTVFFRRVPASFLPHLFEEGLADGTVQSTSSLLADPVPPSRRALDLAALEQGSLLDLLSRFVSGGSHD